MNTPSINPSNIGDLTGSLNFVIEKALKSTDDMLPAMVVAFDRTKNRMTVKPLINLITTGGQRVSRAMLASVPVLQIGGGGFVLNFPFKPGDLGWIKSNDRDISLFLQSYSESAPNTKRIHSFEDAVFIPDVMRGWTIAGEDESGVVLQSLDGSVKVSLTAGKLKLKAPVGEIECDDMIVNASGSYSVLSSSSSHNGVNVGDTHTHPQGNDSAGNSEQDTGYPK